MFRFFLDGRVKHGHDERRILAGEREFAPKAVMRGNLTL
jgi:hypothetical protein